MPIIDDENQLHDLELSKKFNSHFGNSADGRLIDDFGNFWYISQEHDLSNFISLLEENIGIPIGRFLHNSAADSFELILDPVKNMKLGFFSNKKRRKLLKEYWEIYGWGYYDSTTHSITTNVYSSIISGFYLSLIELDQGFRSKIQWRQVKDNLIICEFNDLNKSLSLPQSLPNMPWVKSTNNSAGVSNHLLEKQELGWSIEGKTSFVIPCDMINRIIFNAGGYIDNIKKSVFDFWTLEGVDKRFSSSMICILQSCKELFTASDVFVYLNDSNNWDSIIESHLKPFGLGSIKHLSSTEKTDIFEVSLESNAPLIMGKIAGIWERANGKKCHCFIELNDNNFKVSIESLLSYN